MTQLPHLHPDAPFPQGAQGSESTVDHNSLSLTLPQPHHCDDPHGSGAREPIPPQAEGGSVTLGSLFSLSGPLCAMETSDPVLKGCCEWGRHSGHSRINHYPGIFSKAIKVPRPFPRPSNSQGGSEQS